MTEKAEQLKSPDEQYRQLAADLSMQIRFEDKERLQSLQDEEGAADKAQEWNDQRTGKDDAGDANEFDAKIPSLDKIQEEVRRLEKFSDDDSNKKRNFLVKRVEKGEKRIVEIQRNKIERELSDLDNEQNEAEEILSKFQGQKENFLKLAKIEGYKQDPQGSMKIDAEIQEMEARIENLQSRESDLRSQLSDLEISQTQQVEDEEHVSSADEVTEPVKELEQIHTEDEFLGFLASQNDIKYGKMMFTGEHLEQLGKDVLSGTRDAFWLPETNGIREKAQELLRKKQEDKTNSIAENYQQKEDGPADLSEVGNYEDLYALLAKDESLRAMGAATIPAETLTKKIETIRERALYSYGHKYELYAMKQGETAGLDKNEIIQEVLNEKLQHWQGPVGEKIRQLLDAELQDHMIKQLSSALEDARNVYAQKGGKKNEEKYKQMLQRYTDAVLNEELESANKPDKEEQAILLQWLSMTERNKLEHAKIDPELERFKPIKKMIRYFNGLSWKKKLAVGVGLGVAGGAASVAGVSGMVIAGLFAGKGLAFSSMSAYDRRFAGKSDDLMQEHSKRKNLEHEMMMEGLADKEEKMDADKFSQLIEGKLQDVNQTIKEKHREEFVNKWKSLYSGAKVTAASLMIGRGIMEGIQMIDWDSVSTYWQDKFQDVVDTFRNFSSEGTASDIASSASPDASVSTETISNGAGSEDGVRVDANDEMYRRFNEIREQLDAIAQSIGASLQNTTHVYQEYLSRIADEKSSQLYRMLEMYADSVQNGSTPSQAVQNATEVVEPVSIETPSDLTLDQESRTPDAEDIASSRSNEIASDQNVVVDKSDALNEIESENDDMLARQSYEVQKGDTLVGILRDHLVEDYGPSGELENKATQDYVLDAIRRQLDSLSEDAVRDLGISSGNIDDLAIGDEIDIQRILRDADLADILDKAGSLTEAQEANILSYEENSANGDEFTAEDGKVYPDKDALEKMTNEQVLEVYEDVSDDDIQIIRSISDSIGRVPTIEELEVYQALDEDNMNTSNLIDAMQSDTNGLQSNELTELADGIRETYHLEHIGEYAGSLTQDEQIELARQSKNIFESISHTSNEGLEQFNQPEPEERFEKFKDYMKNQYGTENQELSRQGASEHMRRYITRAVIQAKILGIEIKF